MLDSATEAVAGCGLVESGDRSTDVDGRPEVRATTDELSPQAADLTQDDWGGGQVAEGIVGIDNGEGEDTQEDFGDEPPEGRVNGAHTSHVRLHGLHLELKSLH